MAGPAPSSMRATRYTYAALLELINPPATTVASLDFLRSIAVLMVIANHCVHWFESQTGLHTALGRLPPLDLGWTGVDLFFVLSGYLIGGQLWRELAASGTVRVREFIFRRGLRIWPYYFFVVAWTFVSSDRPLRAYLPDILFLSNYFHHQIGGGWSLSTEEQFYIIVPSIILVLRAQRAHVGQIAVPLALLIALPISRSITLAAYSQERSGVVPSDLPPLLLYTPIHTHSDGLFVGLCIAWISTYRRDLLHGTPWTQSAILPGLMTLIAYCSYQYDRTIFGFTALGLVYGVSLIIALKIDQSLPALRGSRVAHAISRLSFGMYLNHFLILSAVTPKLCAILVASNLNGSAQFVIYFVSATILSTLVACVTFIIVETPFLKLRQRLLPPRV